MEQKQQVQEQQLQQQGFCQQTQIEIASKKNSVQIRINHQNGLSLIQLQKPYDLLPRFLNNIGYKIRKQAQIITNACIQFQNKQIQATTRSKKNTLIKMKERRFSLYEKYILSDNYRLIYCRGEQITKQHNEYVNNFAANYVYLGNVFDYNPNDYSLLRKYDINESISSQTQVMFDSNFECGNLLYVFKQIDNSSQQYDLILHNDTNSRGYTQWFYFSIQNFKKNIKYKFKIINLIKKHSLFQEGMKPWMLSKTKQNTPMTWKMVGNNIVYEKTKIIRERQESKYYYQLSFELTFENQEDIVYIAMSPPYSYTKMVKTVQQLRKKAQLNQKIQYTITIVAHSLSSNGIPMIQIKNSSNHKKPIIAIVARQHPGETWSSYLVQGILKELTGNNQHIQKLRQNYQFIIIPMLNVDGVIFGNFRCDLNGQDLNRKWTQPNKVFHNSLFKIKKIFQDLQKTQKIQFFLDLHGHSKKLNTFCYSCITDEISCRVFPIILDKIDSTFNFPDCTFNLDKSKLKTLRGMLFKLMNNFQIMTIQCSFFGANKSGSLQCFNSQEMFKFGSNILKALDIYLLGSKYEEMSRNSIQQYVKKNIILLQSYRSNDSLDNGSDSDPEQFELSHQERIKNVLPRKQSTNGQSEFKIERRNKTKQIQSGIKKVSNVINMTKNQKSQKSKISYARQPPSSPKQKNLTVNSSVNKPKTQFSLNAIKTTEQQQVYKQPTTRQLQSSKRSHRLVQSRNRLNIKQIIPNISQDDGQTSKKQYTSCSLINPPQNKMAQGSQSKSPSRKHFRKTLHNQTNIEAQNILFNEYLVRKSKHYKVWKSKQINFITNQTNKQINLSQLKFPVQAISIQKQLEQNNKKKVLVLISDKKRQELLSLKKKPQSFSYGNRPLSRSQKKQYKPMESLKNMIPKNKKDSGLSQFSRIWKMNMQRYGKDIKQITQI